MIFPSIPAKPLRRIQMANVVDEVLAALDRKDEAIKELLRQREEVTKEIDAKLARLGYNVEVSGATSSRKGTRKCSNCGQPGHTAKTCTAPTLATASDAKKAPKLMK